MPVVFWGFGECFNFATNPSQMEETRELITAFRNNRDYKHFARRAAETNGTIDNLIQLCYTVDYPFPQYSSWLLAHVADNHFDVLKAYHHQLIDAFLDCTEPSTQRNLGNVLQRFPKTGHREGELLDKLFFFLADPGTKVAVKVYAMNLIFTFLKDYPELKTELKSMVEDGMNKESAAYLSAGKKILKNLAKL